MGDDLRSTLATPWAEADHSINTQVFDEQSLRKFAVAIDDPLESEHITSLRVFPTQICVLSACFFFMNEILHGRSPM